MLPFELPPPPGFDDRPLWTGHGFALGSTIVPVLEYSENFAGWSDDLTSLHEEVAGADHPIDLASRSDAVEQLRQHVTNPDAVILEIGCSSGFLLNDLRAAFPRATVIGADVVRDPLFRLAERLPTVPLIRFDLLRSPLPADSIDAVVMLNVLEHIEDDEGALRNAYELLKPGGVLVLEVPAGPGLYDAYDAELMHFRRYSARSLNDLLERARFRVVRRSHLGFFVFPAFAAVKLKNRLLSRGREAMPGATVRRQAARTAHSRLLRWAFALERTLSKVQLPIGIRALSTALKRD